MAAESPAPADKCAVKASAMVAESPAPAESCAGDATAVLADSPAPAAVEAAPADTSPPAPPAVVSEEEARQQRVQTALSRGEAPIKLEFLVPVQQQQRPADGEQQKRPAPEGGEPGAKKTDDRDRQGGQPYKRKRGMNKNKDRKDNANAMRKVRESQICSRFGYVNCCDILPEGKCKQSHDLDEFFSKKAEAIEEPCPVLRNLGVCPAGLNCRFQGHVVDRKNVDAKGEVLTPESEWVTKVPGVGHPAGEKNIIPFEVVGQLRKKVYDFSRSAEVNKAWQRYCSGADDQPLGALGESEPKRLDIKGKSILAPLTTVGNLPFRRLCVKLGCDVTVGEMALSGSILDGNFNELSLLRRHESEKCFGIQVAGGDVEVMTRLAQFVDEQIDCDFVDINCGCPLDDVHRRGAGSRLMARQKAMEGIVRSMSTVLKTKPLTLKMRTADHEDHKKYPEFQGRYAHKLVPDLEKWGVSAITLHGRTARQRYSKLADWSYTKECSQRRTTDIPFVACGDVLSYADAEHHRAEHGADSIMLGRGALMKPWLFTEINERRDWDISANERFDMIRDFAHYGLEHWGADSRGVETTRRFLLEWLSFTCRYVPLGILEQGPPQINWRPRAYIGRSDLETKLGSPLAQDWIEITEMVLGKVPEGFTFVPKHKSASYDQSRDAAPPVAPNTTAGTPAGGAAATAAAA